MITDRRSDILACGFLATIVLMLSACVKTNVAVWEANNESPADIAFEKPNTDFHKYLSLLAPPLEIYFPKKSDSADTEVSIRRLRDLFRILLEIL